MKIRLWSDIHLEFSDLNFDHIWAPSEEDSDQILLLAGDIGKGMQGRRLVEEACKSFKHVLMTCGNHDFWEQPDFQKTIEDWRAFSGEGSIMIERGPDNFHFLYNDSVIIDGVKFIGGTMWTDFNDGDIISIGAAHRIMNDFVYIKSDGEYITPQFIIKEHDAFVDFLLNEWEKPFDGKIVVMTHHSPGNELRRRGHSRDRVGSAYFADLEQIIGHHDKACLWVHGHTHQPFDYMINNTRVVCNPYGYHNYQTNSSFNPTLIIEI